jgi:iron complex transport system substrate-binding protein
VQRIVSFLPAATEMACALGLEDALVGVSHECDWPPAVRQKPVVVRGALDLASLRPEEIDAAVSARLRQGESLYCVDESLIRALDPDLILTQDLCQVCAPSGNEVARVLRSLERQPQVMFFTPKTLRDVDENLRLLGHATGRSAIADVLIAEHEERLEHVRQCVSRASTTPRVFFAEWLDPVYCAGHWVPEMIAIAGGTDALARHGGDSVRVSWADVIASRPEVIIVAPCGYGLDAAVEQATSLSAREEWSDLPAVREGRVYAVDANAYFARPGPRLVDGIELLAHLFHPECVAWGAGGFQKIVSA